MLELEPSVEIGARVPIGLAFAVKIDGRASHRLIVQVQYLAGKLEVGRLEFNGIEFGTLGFGFRIECVDVLLAISGGRDA